MPRQQEGKEEIRKVTKVGQKSYSVTIPISIVKNLKWREHQKVVVKQEGDRVVIEDWSE